MHLLKQIVVIFLLVVAVIFIANNYENVKISLYPLPFMLETKLFMIIIIFFLLGLFFGFAICSKAIVKKSLENFFNLRKIKKLQKNQPHE